MATFKLLFFHSFFSQYHFIMFNLLSRYVYKLIKNKINGGQCSTDFTNSLTLGEVTLKVKVMQLMTIQSNSKTGYRNKYRWSTFSDVNNFEQVFLHIYTVFPSNTSNIKAFLKRVLVPQHKDNIDNSIEFSGGGGRGETLLITTTINDQGNISTSFFFFEKINKRDKLVKPSAFSNC